MFRCTRSVLVVCLLLLGGANAFAEEDFERMLELYRQSGSANMAQRVRDYEALQEMRRARGERHLPAGSQFDFARVSFRQVRANAPGVTGPYGCAWTSAGPTNLNGRVVSIAIDPTDNTRIYAATVGGIWRSTDSGRRWQRVSDDFLAKVFGSIAVNPGKPNEILAGGGDPNLETWRRGDGLWRSMSYGAPGTWSKVTSAFDDTIVYRIRIDPAPPNDIYVAASNGVWRGVHGWGGVSITFTPVGGFDAMAHDIAVDFSAMPRKIYAGVREPSAAFGVGIHKWDGSQWLPADSGIDTSDSETINLALSQSDPDILYAKVSQRSDQTLVGIYKTTTGAIATFPNKAWKALPLGGPNAVPDIGMGWYNQMLEVDPTDPDRVYAGSVNMWMSTDGGDTWEDISAGRDPSYQAPIHTDTHTLAFDPANPKILWVGNDGGIDRSTDVSQPVWRWNDVSHGMIITMFYRLTSNLAYPTLLAGGAQDNGTGLTFGNRTWYPPGAYDGSDVGSDAGNPDTIYATWNGEGFDEAVNPVPGTPGGPKPGEFGYGAKVAWNTPVPLRPPVLSDVVTHHAALSAGGKQCETQTILKTIDGVTWMATNTKFQPGAAAIALASAPSGGFKTYLAVVAYRPPKTKDCPNFMGTMFPPYVIRTDDGGNNWFPVLGLPAGVEPWSVAFDPYDKFRSYVTYTGSDRIYMSQTGVSYAKIPGSWPNQLPSGGVRRVAADPFDKNVLYAATSVGMFRGEVTPSIPPSAVWTPFDEGLPDGMEINDVWVDPGTGIMTIGSFGYGAFRRDIRKGAVCPERMLVVRDTVYDDGRQPSIFDVPDAEHPIPDLARPEFYKPDDTFAGQAWWWTTRDIRVDVPANDPPANQIADADSVEFEVCPTTVVNCAAGTMIDSAPQAGKAARVYVQVTNRGVEPVAKTRVIALWNNSGGAFEPLPHTFWTKTFPGNGTCGSLDPTTGWQLIDPIDPCRTIETVAPDLPELARFDWKKVPQAADGAATILTVVESDEDRLDPWIRQKNELEPSELVPNSRHIALRSLHTKTVRWDEIQIPIFWPVDLLHLPNEMGELELVVSKVDLRDSVRIALPAGLPARAGSGSVRRTRITEPELLRKLESLRLDPDNAWELSGDEPSLFVDLREGQRVTTGMIATPEDRTAAARVSLVVRSRDKVVGGNVMILRPEMEAER